MKSVIKLIFLLPLVVVSCGKMLPEPVVDPAEYDGDYSFSQELTVPIGTRAVFIEPRDWSSPLTVRKSSLSVSSP